MVELYVRSLIRLYGVVLNQLSTKTNLPPLYTYFTFIDGKLENNGRFVNKIK
jgi:hypothetical protein